MARPECLPLLVTPWVDIRGEVPPVDVKQRCPETSASGVAVGVHRWSVPASYILGVYLLRIFVGVDYGVTWSYEYLWELCSWSSCVCVCASDDIFRWNMCSNVCWSAARWGDSGTVTVSDFIFFYKLSGRLCCIRGRDPEWRSVTWYLTVQLGKYFEWFWQARSDDFYVYLMQGRKASVYHCILHFACMSVLMCMVIYAWSFVFVCNIKEKSQPEVISCFLNWKNA